MNYYEHHLGDWIRDTAHLSMLEEGAYRRLVDAYYTREKPLPSEVREIYRLSRAATKQDRKAVDTILREFFTKTDDGWRNNRCDKELARYLDKQEKAKRSANARWQTSERNANASEAHMPTQCEGNALQSPVTSNQSPNKEQEPDPSGLDAAAWATWVEYRKEIKKPIKPVSVTAAKKAMASLGLQQLAAVEHTKANGWQGLIAPKTNGKAPPMGTPTAATPKIVRYDYRGNVIDG